MRLSWDKLKDGTHLLAEFSNGEIVEIRASVWSRVTNNLGDGMFHSINKYWATIPKPQMLQFEEIYRNIFKCFGNHLSAHDLNPIIKVHAAELMNMFEWNKFKLWCTLHGDLYLLNGLKETLDDKDKEGLTYYTEDYTDLMVFSVMLKAVMPLWALYHNELEDSIGKMFIQIAAVNLIRTPAVSVMPPILKLESYIDCFTDIKIKKAGNSLLTGIGSEEVPIFLLSMALIKKVAIYDVCDPNGSIVKNVYHLLTERCNDISKKRPNEKKDTDNDGQDVGIADRYKIVQRIPPGISTMMEFYTSNVYDVAHALDPTIPKELIDQYNSKVSAQLDIQPFHLPVLAIVNHNVMAGRSLELIPYGSLLNVIKASGAALEHWGFLELAELLTTQPSLRDIYTLTSSLTGYRSYIQLRPDLQNELDQLYRYVSDNKNPGILLIESVIKDVTRYDWSVKSTTFNNLRNSLATLILKQFGGNRPCEV